MDTGTDEPYFLHLDTRKFREWFGRLNLSRPVLMSLNKKMGLHAVAGDRKEVLYQRLHNSVAKLLEYWDQSLSLVASDVPIPWDDQKICSTHDLLATLANGLAETLKGFPIPEFIYFDHNPIYGTGPRSDTALATNQATTQEQTPSTNHVADTSQDAAIYDPFAALVPMNRAATTVPVVTSSAASSRSPQGPIATPSNATTGATSNSVAAPVQSSTTASNDTSTTVSASSHAATTPQRVLPGSMRPAAPVAAVNGTTQTTINFVIATSSNASASASSPSLPPPAPNGQLHSPVPGVGGLRTPTSRPPPSKAALPHPSLVCNPSVADVRKTKAPHPHGAKAGYEYELNGTAIELGTSEDPFWEVADVDPLAWLILRYGASGVMELSGGAVRGTRTVVRCYPIQRGRQVSHSGPTIMEWPVGINLRIPGARQVLDMTKCRKTEKYKNTRDTFFDISALVDATHQAFKVNVEFATSCKGTYFICAQAMKPISPETLIAKLRGTSERVYTVENSKRFINASFKSNDMVSFEQVSLKDPQTLMRISIPARGRGCLHWGCFDLSVYLSANRNIRTWLCPRCNRSAPFHSLIIDLYFEEALSRFPKEDDIILNSDASISAKSDSALAAPKRSESAAPVEIISLDSDDEDVYVPPRPATTSALSKPPPPNSLKLSNGPTIALPYAVAPTKLPPAPTLAFLNVKSTASTSPAAPAAAAAAAAAAKGPTLAISAPSAAKSPVPHPTPNQAPSAPNTIAFNISSPKKASFLIEPSTTTGAPKKSPGRPRTRLPTIPSKRATTAKPTQVRVPMTAVFRILPEPPSSAMDVSEPQNQPQEQQQDSEPPHIAVREWYPHTRTQQLPLPTRKPSMAAQFGPFVPPTLSSLTNSSNSSTSPNQYAQAPQQQLVAASQHQQHQQHHLSPPQQQQQHGHSMPQAHSLHRSSQQQQHPPSQPLYHQHSPHQGHAHHPHTSPPPPQHYHISNGRPNQTYSGPLAPIQGPNMHPGYYDLPPPIPIWNPVPSPRSGPQSPAPIDPHYLVPTGGIEDQAAASAMATSGTPRSPHPPPHSPHSPHSHHMPSRPTLQTGSSEAPLDDPMPSHSVMTPSNGIDHTGPDPATHLDLDLDLEVGAAATTVASTNQRYDSIFDSAFDSEDLLDTMVDAMWHDLQDSHHGGHGEGVTATQNQPPIPARVPPPPTPPAVQNVRPTPQIPSLPAPRPYPPPPAPKQSPKASAPAPASPAFATLPTAPVLPTLSSRVSSLQSPSRAPARASPIVVTPRSAIEAANLGAEEIEAILATISDDRSPGSPGPQTAPSIVTPTASTPSETARSTSDSHPPSPGPPPSTLASSSTVGLPSFSNRANDDTKTGSAPQQPPAPAPAKAPPKPSKFASFVTSLLPSNPSATFMSSSGSRDVPISLDSDDDD